MSYRVLSKLKSPQPNSIIRNLLIHNVPPASNFKVGNKVFVKTKFFQTTWPSKKLSEKYLGPYEIIAQPSTLLFNLRLLESMCSVHPVFHVSMLKPAMSNTFSKRIQLASILVIIDGEPKYKVSQIVDSKIDH